MTDEVVTAVYRFFYNRLLFVCCRGVDIRLGGFFSQVINKDRRCNACTARDVLRAAIKPNERTF